MNKPTALAFVCLATLAGCGGSGGGSSPDPTPNPPVGQIAFKNLSGSAPADLGLGRPLTVEWVMPAGFTPQSVSLEATLVAGPTANSRTCVESAGALAASALSATWTIPDLCEERTVKSVQLRITAENAAGQRTTTTRMFSAPVNAATFLPLRQDLPVLKITTDNLAPIVSKDDYINAQMTLESNVPGDAAVVGGLQIRGFGAEPLVCVVLPLQARLQTRDLVAQMLNFRRQFGTLSA